VPQLLVILGDAFHSPQRYFVFLTVGGIQLADNALESLIMTVELI